MSVLQRSLRPDQATAARGRQLQQVGAIQQNLAADVAGRGLREQPREREARDTFPAPALADNGERLAFFERERNALHGIDNAMEIIGKPRPEIYSGDASIYVLEAGAATGRTATVARIEAEHAGAVVPFASQGRLGEELAHVVGGGALVGDAQARLQERLRMYVLENPVLQRELLVNLRMVRAFVLLFVYQALLGAVVYGHEQGNIAINAIHELVRDAGKPAWDWTAPAKDEALIAKVNGLAEEKLRAAYQIRNKQARTHACREAYGAVMAGLKADGVEFDSVKVENMLFDIEAHIVRSQILAGEPRIDGRDTRTVRPIEIRNSVLPRTHGSALFTRGETQALVVTTLGTERDAQRIDALAGEYEDRFMLHYNMPPFATGEVGRMGSTKRREIGHGRLAKRALAAVLPTKEEFPYTMRVVSEITESNGSSSMASVCGGCLSLMDAGVPMKAHVAGIAMGLIKDANRFAVLTDILGDEDHLGDMDFKVAGTTNGVTALQMDIKIQGITKEIMQVALAQAKEARMHILGKMQDAMSEAKTEVSNFAPKLFTMKINPEKIRDVIGKGGATIRALTEETGTQININEDGTITIAAADGAKADEAKRRIEQITAEVEIGKVYEGPVTKLLDFGALINLLPGKDGLLHISQIAHERVEKVSDYLQEGQIVKVKVLETDEKGRVKLSMKALIERPAAPAQSE